MTTYHYSRAREQSPITFGAYFKFLVSIFLLFILDSYNLPQFFGGAYHLFLFEIGLFFLLFIKKFKNYFFTILIFYNLIDLLQSNYIGSSFIAFIVSFGAVKLLFNVISPDPSKALNRWQIFFSSVFYIGIFVALKVILISSVLHFYFNSEAFTFFAKSCFYTCFLFLNLFLIFGRKKAF